MSASELTLLVRATARLYRTAAQDALKGVRLNWWAALLPVVYLVTLSVLSPLVLGIVGRFVGGFVLGLLSAFLVAHFFAVVGASVMGERVGVRESVERAGHLFSPVIGVLFALFVLNLVAGFALRENQALRAVLNVVLVILFNPIGEVVALQRGVSGGFFSEGLFSESINFMKENAAEWSVAFVVIFLPLILTSPGDFLSLFVSANPLQLVPGFIGLFLTTFSALTPLGMILGAPLALLVVLFVLVFRGALYRGLSESSRRKRIYQERNR